MLCLTEFDLTEAERAAQEAPAVVCESTKFVTDRCQIEACESLLVREYFVLLFLRPAINPWN